MSDIERAPEDQDTASTVVIMIIMLIIFIGIGMLLAWGLLECVKAISHAWHEGAK